MTSSGDGMPASTSGSAMTGTARKQARLPRSRLDRPCDLCRRHKHLCVIEIRSEPCVSCRARSKVCTFDLPPTARKRKLQDRCGEEVGSEHPSNANEGNEEETLEGLSYIASEAALNVDPGDLAARQKGAIDIHFDHDNDPAFSLNGHLWSEDADAASVPIVHPPSLDLENSDQHESHFLGAGAFSAFTLRKTLEPPRASHAQEVLSFRQVSSDPSFPVFFVKRPTLMYGRTLNDGQSAYRAIEKICSGVCEDGPSKAVSKVQRKTLPAVPFINAKRLESSCLGLEGSGPVPYALLSGIVAHATHYIPELLPFHQQIWHHALLALDDEYRQPRLSTLQLALLQLYSRPQERGENSGQLTIGLARAIGAAHLLGLHLDPSNWALPDWERHLRKRIWWALVIQDKWRALLYGRPSYLHRSSHLVSIPTVNEGDWGKYGSELDRISMETFVSTCHLTLIVDELLQAFFDVDPMGTSQSTISRIAKLEALLEKTNAIGGKLFQTVGWQVTEQTLLGNPPTGISSFQLSHLGLNVIIHRLLLDCVDDNSSVQASAALPLAVHACEQVINLVSNLTEADQDTYWAAYSSHHISNTINLLLRIAVRSRHTNATLFPTVINAANSFVATLCRSIQNSRWDIVSSALRPIASSLHFAEQEVPEIHDAYRDIARALGIPTNEPVFSQDDFLASLGITDQDLFAPLSNDLDWLANLGPWSET